jgi:hypothetical protein
MSALLLMPLVIEVIVAGKGLQDIVYMCLLLLQMTILEGEMGPIAWVPTIVRASVAALLPASEPPDAPIYVAKRHRQEVKDSWWGRVTGRLQGIADGMFNDVRAVTRLSHLETSDNKPRTNTYMAAQRR